MLLMAIIATLTAVAPQEDVSEVGKEEIQNEEIVLFDDSQTEENQIVIQDEFFEEDSEELCE